ncbi:hypothetical protein ACJX0J_014305, partial [Zea mays]
KSLERKMMLEQEWYGDELAMRRKKMVPQRTCPYITFVENTNAGDTLSSVRILSG